MTVMAPLAKYSKKKGVIVTPTARRKVWSENLTFKSLLQPKPWNTFKFRKYILIVRKEFIELLKKPNYRQSNLTAEERFKLMYLTENHNLTIKGADKSGKIVILDTADYAEHCELLLNDREFHEKVKHNCPSLSNIVKKRITKTWFVNETQG